MRSLERRLQTLVRFGNAGRALGFALAAIYIGGMTSPTPIVLLAAIGALALAGPGCGGDEPSFADSPPVVTLVRPNGGEFAPTQVVAWRARDADEGDVLTIDLVLEQLDASGAVVDTVRIAEGLANTVGVDDTTFDWARDDVPLVNDDGEAIPYRLRVVATDGGGNETQDASDEAFVLLDDSAFENLDWGDVGPIFVRYCRRCHGQPSATEGIEFFRLDKYNSEDEVPPINDDLGVFDVRGQVSSELLSRGTMPPQGNAQPSDVDKLRIERWLADGAPFQAD